MAIKRAIARRLECDGEVFLLPDVESVQHAMDDIQAGRTVPIQTIIDELRVRIIDPERVKDYPSDKVG